MGVCHAYLVVFYDSNFDPIILKVASIVGFSGRNHHLWLAKISSFSNLVAINSQVLVGYLLAALFGFSFNNYTFDRNLIFRRAKSNHISFKYVYCVLVSCWVRTNYTTRNQAWLVMLKS